jgi:hypothetical protein
MGTKTLIYLLIDDYCVANVIRVSSRRRRQVNGEWSMVNALRKFSLRLPFSDSPLTIDLSPLFLPPQFITKAAFFKNIIT